MSKSQITICFEIVENGDMAIACQVDKGGDELLDSVADFVSVSLSVATHKAVKRYIQLHCEEKANAIH